MKKSASIIIVSALLAALSGCNKTEEKSENNTDSRTESITQSSADESAQLTVSAPPELSDDVKKFLSDHPQFVEYRGDDGEKLPPERIVDIEYPTEDSDGKVTYDFGYLTYGAPCFATTIGNDDWKSDGSGFTDAIEWLHFYIDKVEGTELPKSFAVNVGDKLENGLVVKSAKTTCDFYSSWSDEDKIYPSSTVEFDGTLSVEGVLFKHKGDPQYFSVPGDVFFYPNTTKNSQVPMYTVNDFSPIPGYFDTDAAVVEGGVYFVGNLDRDDFDVDIDEILGDKNYKYVKATLKNIRTAPGKPA